MKIAQKAVLYTISTALLATILSVALISLVTSHYSDRVITKQTHSKLDSIREALNNELQMYFSMLFREVKILSQQRDVVKSMQSFADGLNELQSTANVSDPTNDPAFAKFSKEFNEEFAYLNGGTQIEVLNYLNNINKQAKSLQMQYIVKNPNSLNEKYMYIGSDVPGKYGEAHRQYHPHYKRLKDSSMFYDLMLVDNTGTVVYSVEKEIDFGTSLVTGPFKNDTIASLYKRAIKADNDTILVSDFATYIPSYNMPSMFLATPVYDPNTGTRHGVMIAQVSISAINSILSMNKNWEEVGLQKTGEAFLIGHSGVLRSDLRGLVESPDTFLKRLTQFGIPQEEVFAISARKTGVGLQQLPIVAKAIAAKKKSKDVISFTNYEGMQTIASYGPAEIPGVKWNIVVSMGHKEAYAELKALNISLLSAFITCSILMVVLAIIVGTWVGHRATRPIVRLINEIQRIIDSRDLTKRIKVVRNDEFKYITISINSMLSSLQYTFQKTSESIEQYESLANQIRTLATEPDRASNADVEQKLSEAGNSLSALNDKLKHITKDFRIFARKARRTRGW